MYQRERKLFQEFEQLRKRYWGQHLWARGYFAVTVGNVNSTDVQKYIEEQEIHHKHHKSLSFKTCFKALTHTTSFSWL
ncbi:transposase [Candidatus Mesenet endosymbiont of Agriotes lineatus]|uniref:transposase n=1 Tax=Candidatus Mesenet endosymbiont of Agriotes lineatus TaxID=3077948 RepID=UPI003977CDD0